MQAPCDLSDCTATELLRLYRHGAASPVEATRAVLARITALDPEINAFRLVDEAAALNDAAASEARWKAGQPKGLLDGVPVSVKDLILTRGSSTLRGSRTVDPEQAWNDDAPSVARLRQHGAVLLGKTTTPEFGCKGTTDSYLSGITRNPWNLAHTPGGSSGGAAAAVAARMGPLALGTDGAGSVRIPSAFCGIVGLKPSFGRVPAWPASPFGTVAHIGPHARTVEDAALLLTAIAEPDVRDWYSLQYDARDYRVGLDDGVRGLRIAYSPKLAHAGRGADVHPEVAEAVARAASTLAHLGAMVDEVDPGFEDPIELICALWFLGAAAVLSKMSDAQRALTDPFLRWQAEQGVKLSALAIVDVNLRRAELGVHMKRFHQRYDLLLTPGVAVPAMKAEATDAWKEGRIEDFLGWTPFSYPFNLTQQPAIVVPCGLTRDGLPVAAQLVGPMFGDALVLRGGRALQGALPAMPCPAAAKG